jgi:septal ring factor EnvC (AmiA/AmiB activator)
MIEQSRFTKTAHVVRGLGVPAQRGIVAAVAALLIVVGAVVWRIGSNSPATLSAPAKVVAAARNPAIDELVGTTKALDASQQQVIDQLQIVQDLLAAQRAETKRTADKVAALSDKLEGLRQSFASIQQPAVDEAEAAPPSDKVAQASRPRTKANRAASARKFTKSKRHRTASTRR